MEARPSLLLKVLAVVGVCGYQFAIHWAIVHGGALAAVLAYVPLVLLCYWIVRRGRSQRWGLVLASVMLIGSSFYVLDHHDAAALTLASGAPHAAINGFLLWLFARTLAPGCEPLITRFARQFRGGMPIALETYTRRVTIFWCCFFSAQLVLSALLYAFASLTTWSFFINILNFPLIIAALALEYAYRLLRYRDYPHASMLTGARMFQDAAGDSRSREVR